MPTKGDVPTIGYGSTFYEDGATVKLTDPPITRSHAEKLARGVLGQFEVAFRQSLDGASLTQYEYDAYLDFSYQFGLGAWRGSSMRRFVLAGDYGKACDALLLWKKQAGRDCSLPKNWGPQGCKGVWSRQMERHAKCMGEAAK
ncbi:MAG: glycoside hydrolase family protein [Zoogloeaceae bacterium]|nr:glycoside hydrolase family protein [Zoogloeaceae bacterium]